MQMKRIQVVKLLAFMLFPLGGVSTQAQGKITIDHKTQRYVGNESTFNRSKYLTFHAFFKKEDADFEKWKKEYNIDSDYVGARMFNSPATKHKNGVYPKVKKKYNGVREVSNYVSTGHPSSIFYDKTVDYSQVDITKFSKEAAQFSAAYFRDEADFVPLYFEPFNEPMIKAVTLYPEGRNGKYKKEKINAITTKMCEFHRDVAQEIHATPELSNMKVAGFGSAFPEFDANNFGLWEARYKNFIDIAGADIDIYTVHLYDGSGVNNKDGRRSGSNSEAILDMIEAYSFIKLNEVKPFAITEYGRLVPDQPNYKKNGNYVPLVNAQAVRSQMHMVMNFIERGNDVVLSTPFTIGKQQPKARYSKSGLWTKTENGNWELTERKYFFEVWKDVKGERVRFNSTNVDVQTQAFVDGKQLYVVLNNLNDETQNINLDLLDAKGLKDVSIKRLNIYKDKLPELTETQQSSLTDLSINYGETVVLTYNFKSNIKFTNTIRSKKHYASSYLKPIKADTEIDFTIENIKAGKGEATLRLGLGRDHGLSLQPIILVNGNELNLPNDPIRGYDQNTRKRFFGTLEIPVPMVYLKDGTNEIGVKFRDNGGHVSSVILQVQNADKSVK